jgi:glutamate racemase
VEPGIKPASEHSLTKNIAIMATENTLASDKYRNLLMRFNPHTRIFNLPCPGLADLIEARAPRSEIRALLQQLLAPLDTLPVDHLVLGCTHYPLVKDEIQACLPTVTLVDTGEAIARVAERHWHTQPEDAALPPVRLMTTGDVGRLQGFVRHHPALRCFSDSLIQSIVLG